MVRKCLHNEDGLVYTWVIFLMFPLTMLVLFMFFDISRFQGIYGQQMTMADSAALSAALTATPEYQYNYMPVYDGQGNLTGVQARITGVKAVIQDPVKAEATARQAALKNLGMITGQQNAKMLAISISPAAGANDDFSGQVAGGGNSYYVRIKSEVIPFVLGPLAALYGVDLNDKGIGARATGQAVISP